MGKKNIYMDPKRPWTKTGEENRWEATQEFTGDKPFGVVKASEGRGTMRLVRYYDIDEDKEGYFPLMRERLLNIISEWVSKGWLSIEDINNKIASSG
jgi:hypothetical protein